jgi:hypothetical protein
MGAPYIYIYDINHLRVNISVGTTFHPGNRLFPEFSIGARKQTAGPDHVSDIHHIDRGTASQAGRRYIHEKLT